MGQATVKAARRQIRRAFGAEAIGTLADHHQAIVTMSAILEQTRGEAIGLATEFAAFKQYVESRISLDAATENLMASSIASLTDTRAAAPKTFRARLRWLFLGR